MNSDIKQYLIYERDGRGLFPLEKRHLEKLKEWRNTQMAILRQWKSLTDMDQEKWFEGISERKDEVLFSILVFEESGDERFIGYCGLVNIDYINRRGEVSFFNPRKSMVALPMLGTTVLLVLSLRKMLKMRGGSQMFTFVTIWLG